MRYMVRIGRIGWMVWDRDERGPAQLGDRQLVRLSEEEANELGAALNLPRAGVGILAKTQRSALKIERMIRAELAQFAIVAPDLKIAIGRAGRSWRVICKSDSDASLCPQVQAVAEQMKLLFALKA
jgi:hypothetical protein